MAARPRKRPLIDRLRDAKHDLDTERAIQKVHAKMCPRCGKAQNDYGQRCDIGWDNAKSEHRALRKWERLAEQQDRESRQGVLF